MKNSCPAGKAMITTCLQCMAGIGIVIIIYGTAVFFAPKSADVRLFLDGIRSYIDWISITLALIGVFLVALSAYFNPHPRDPDKHSLKYVAPSVLLLVVVALFAMYIQKKPLNQPLVLGFSILGFSGATLRSLPFSEQQPETFDAPLFRPWPWWRINSNDE